MNLEKNVHQVLILTILIKSATIEKYVLLMSNKRKRLTFFSAPHFKISPFSLLFSLLTKIRVTHYQILSAKKNHLSQYGLFFKVSK